MVPARLRRDRRQPQQGLACCRWRCYAIVSLRRCPESPMLSDPLFWLVAVAAVTVVGISKGGFAGLGVLGVPLLAIVMSPVKAAAILLPILVLQDWVSLLSYRRSFDKRVLLVPLAGALAG